MKLLTYLHQGAERVGAHIPGDAALLVDLQHAAALRGLESRPFDSMPGLISSGKRHWDRAAELVLRPPEESLIQLGEVELLAPLPRPVRMRDFSAFEAHGAAAGSIPEAWYRLPLYYKVNTLSIVGPDAVVRWPEGSREVDYELEAAVVLGTGGRGLSATEVASGIFGYTVFNDYSARDWQWEEITCPLGPSRSKDFDGANVLGPCIATPDEVEDFYNLPMIARVNGEEWSRGSTSSMYHRFEDMIATLSESETLVAGEVFGSGTVGSGCGFELGRYPKRGDRIELEIEKIGTLRSAVI
ncbi:fumarylacetoacetate hydrolase family protein [Pseudohaliea sp.]|uniref:fumarylacetoacetate hydrolase family protein n=1 Tax=Pseudohaliea sp. TaxID=2740289 RepID=UPI0032F08F8B